MKKKMKFVTFSLSDVKNLLAVISAFFITAGVIALPVVIVSKNINSELVNFVLYTSVKKSYPKKEINIAQAMLNFSVPTLSFDNKAPSPSPEPLTAPVFPTESETTAIAYENPNQKITYHSAEENGYKSIDGIYINNQTGKSINIEKLLNKELDLSLSSEPSVLILHTHTSESYSPENQSYTPTDTDRTLDENFNMIAVGKIIQECLSSAGINTIHDTTINDYPSYSQSYSKSLKLAQSYIQKYPSIKIVIDVHRDAIVTKDGVKMRPMADFDTPTAQVMSVVGTNDTGLSHPNWETNLSFAIKLQHEMNTLCPSLARPINLRRQRFNHHVAPYAFILEVGTNGNTLDEAKEAAKLFSQSLISLLQK